MRARTALLLLILAAVAAFAALDWSAITTPTEIRLVLTRVEAPLGVVLLLVAGGVSALSGVFLTWIETPVMLETPRYARELAAQRQLAGAAEAPRYTGLGACLRGGMATLRALAEGKSEDVIARLGRVEQQLRGEIDGAGNTLSAHVAEPG